MSEQPRVVQMTQEEAVAKLQKSHVHFAIPCYGGNMSESTFSSFAKHIINCMKFNIPFSFDTMTNESLVPRARNNLVAKFLANKAATHLMFIDADIGFDSESILRMILHDTTVVCGLYPMKGLPIRYVMNTTPDARQVGSLFEVSTAGTGFMMIKRSIIEELVAAMPELKYKDSLNLGAEYEPFMYALFDTLIDENGHYLSEDWTFCKRVREVIKRPIWIDTDIKLDHIGTYKFAGDLDQISKLVEQWKKNSKPEQQLSAYDSNN